MPKTYLVTIRRYHGQIEDWPARVEGGPFMAAIAAYRKWRGCKVLNVR